MRLNFYTVEELERVVSRAARLLNAPTTEDGGREIARRSRGTPRIAGRLLRRVRDFAHAAGSDSIDAAVADRALDRLESMRSASSHGPPIPDEIADLYGGGRWGSRRCRGIERAARHDRGRDRAVPHSAWPHRPHRKGAASMPRLFPPWAAVPQGARTACSNRECCEVQSSFRT